MGCDGVQFGGGCVGDISVYMVAIANCWCAEPVGVTWGGGGGHMEYLKVRGHMGGHMATSRSGVTWGVTWPPQGQGSHGGSHGHLKVRVTWGTYFGVGDGTRHSEQHSDKV